MTEIQIVNLNRQNNNNYIELTYKMTLTLPAIYGTGSNPIEGLAKIVGAYPERFQVEVIPVTGTVITVTETVSVATSVTQAQIKTQLENRYGQLRTKLDSLTLDAWDNMSGQSWNGTVWSSTNTVTDLPTESNLGITITGAAAAAVTLTIPAVSGKFHQIAYVIIQAYSTAARTGSATPILVTSTNLPGNPVLNFATAAAVGTVDEKRLEKIKSSAPNTATTIVCPATTGIIWRVNVFYSVV